MKYFTLAHWIADQDLDSESTATFKAVDDYKAYLSSVANQLPTEFVRMLKTICIHDANLIELDTDLLACRVTLRLDAGDVTMREGRKVKLHYIEVSHVSSVSDPNKGFDSVGYGDLGSDEIEVLEGGNYEHRILFSSGIEMTIRFRAFQLENL